MVKTLEDASGDNKGDPTLSSDVNLADVYAGESEHRQKREREIDGQGLHRFDHVDPRTSKRSKIDRGDEIVSCDNRIGDDPKSVASNKQQAEKSAAKGMASSHPVVSAFSPVVTRSKSSEKASLAGSNANSASAGANSTNQSPDKTKRWRGKNGYNITQKQLLFSDQRRDAHESRESVLHLPFTFLGIVHQMAEDYVQLTANMMYPATRLRPYGHDPSRREYPIEDVSTLGYLRSPIRRGTIIEKWSPYEIALFEAALLHHGKEFHLVSEIVETKTTKEVIDFYYIWKKTSHYKKWKDQFVPNSELIDMESPVKAGKL